MSCEKDLRNIFALYNSIFIEWFLKDLEKNSDGSLPSMEKCILNFNKRVYEGNTQNMFDSDKSLHIAYIVRLTCCKWYEEKLVNLVNECIDFCVMQRFQYLFRAINDFISPEEYQSLIDKYSPIMYNIIEADTCYTNYLPSMAYDVKYVIYNTKRKDFRGI